MKPSEPLSTENAGVNKEQEVFDFKHLRRNAGPTFTEIANVDKGPEGMDLKGLREAKGFNLKDIFLVTRITVTNLEAIEAGHYDLLPEPVYTRTFIKTYAEILETDSKPILQQYEKYLTSRDKINEASESEEDLKALPLKEKKPHNIRFSLSIAAFLMLCGLIVLIVLVDVKDIKQLFSIPQGSSPKITSPPAPATAPEGNLPANPPAGSSPSMVTTPAQAPVNRSAGGQKQEPALKLKIEAVEKTWIRIAADQKDSEQMLLSKGDLLERTARESFVVDIGNAGGILVSFQDKPLPSLGKRGEVVHLKLP